MHFSEEEDIRYKKINVNSKSLINKTLKLVLPSTKKWKMKYSHQETKKANFEIEEVIENSPSAISELTIESYEELSDSKIVIENK
jgi:hypothetical protein